MARSESEMLRDLLAVVRDVKLHTGQNAKIVAEVSAYLASPPAPKPLPPKKPKIEAPSVPSVPSIAGQLNLPETPNRITIKTAKIDEPSVEVQIDADEPSLEV